MALSSLLAACVNLAPDYERPASPIDDEWPVSVAPAAGATAPVAADVAWFEFYGDDRLRRLIALALAHNRDLRATALDIEAARAQYRIARAAEWPAIDAGASGTNQGIGAIESESGIGQTQRRYAAALSVSAFELDFFGRLRNLREQALQVFLASEETLRAAHISLVSEVAIAFATLEADQQRLRLAEETFASQRTSFELTRRTFEIGAASALDIAQAQTSVDTARADIATFRTQVTQDLNALIVLVGQPVEPALLPDASAPGEARPPLTTFDNFAAGLPSELLQNRPDVLAAERSLRAANANIGAARATMFPSITLTTSIGSASPELSSLFDSGTRTWSFVPEIVMPIFDAGATRASVRAAEVQREAAVAAYERTIQVAFREVADALAQRRDIDDLIDARLSLVTATEKSYRLSYERYRKGIDSYLTLLDAQRSLYSAQQNLITARLLQASNRVTLYRVFGGGWQDGAG